MSGDVCPDCTGTALQDGVYSLTHTEIFASACGELWAQGALSIKGNTFDMITVIPLDLSGKNNQTTHTSGTFTIAGTKLDLTATCDVAGYRAADFATSSNGKLLIGYGNGSPGNDDYSLHKDGDVYQLESGSKN